MVWIPFLSIVQMPGGVPVATVANNAKMQEYLATQILGVKPMKI